MNPSDQLLTIRDFVRWATSEFNRHELFYGHGTENAWDEANYLILAALKLPWDIDRSMLDARLIQQEREQLERLIRQRIEQRIPVAYLVGEAWFHGLPFYVNEHTLIPRSPIGELIEQQFSPWLQAEPERILDMCTGSGCIGIACAMEFEYSQVDLVDISEPALEVAKRNIARYQLQPRVHAIQSDLFAALDDQVTYDLIVSNPPYVDAADFGDMPKEYQHEPELALVSGPDGLDACRAILREAPRFLTEQGLLVVEVGNSASALEEAFPQVPFTWVEFEQGGHGVFVFDRQQLVDFADQF